MRESCPTDQRLRKHAAGSSGTQGATLGSVALGLISED
jgi:hypothetical protein